ncbi:cytokine receptor common subunit beta-like [Discoglossus pictus]
MHNVSLTLTTILNSSDFKFKRVACQQKETSSDLIWKCHYRENTNFYIGYQDDYTFLADEDLKSYILINSTKKDIVEKKVTKPIIYVSEERYFLRWAGVPYNLTTQEALQCEVSYKEESKSWEDSRSGLCQFSWGIILRDQLLPKLNYVARMRAKPWFDDESWSNWSSEVVIPLRSKVNSSDDAKPRNLRCVNSTCMWETRLEVADSVQFSLYYRQNQLDNELECKPSCQKEMLHHPYISCHCHIPDRDFNLLMVTVKPKQETKFIPSCSNIQGPSMHLMIEERGQGELFIAKWSPEVIHGVSWIYQICYGIDNQTLEQIHLNCEHKSINQSGAPEFILKLHQHLQPSTRYYVKVRIRVDQPKPNMCYSGPWSEWSNIQRLETKAVVDLHPLYMMIPICFFILIICSVYASKVLKRYKQWEKRIPDPSKGIFTGDFLEKKSKLNWQCQQHSMYEELIDVCSPFSLERVPKDLISSEKSLDDLSSTGMELMAEEDPNGIFPFILQEEDIDANIVVSGYKAFSEVVCDLKNEKSMDTKLQDNSFDGLYINYPSG